MAKVQAPTTAPEDRTLRDIMGEQFEQLNGAFEHLVALEDAVGCRTDEIDAGESVDPPTLPFLADLMARRLVDLKNRLRGVAELLG